MSQGIHHVDRDRCADLDRGARIEWLVTNGRGGYAMATVSQMLTRRYHGLLVAAADPPVGRFVLLAKLDAAVTVDDSICELATNEYVGAVHPRGCGFLESFTTRPHPTWLWRAGSVLIEQSLCMAWREDATFIRYRLVEGSAAVRLSVRPLCTHRHFHTLTRASDVPAPVVKADGDRLTLCWSGERPACVLSHNGTFETNPDWYHRFFLAAEARRGYDAEQDLFAPGAITAPLRSGDQTGLVLAASTSGRSWTHWSEAFSRAVSRDAALRPDATSADDDPPSGTRNPQSAIRNPQLDDPLLEPLMGATDHFSVQRGDDLMTIIAGYPWFGDWGRDTFISLPGLCLLPGRFEQARKIILAFARHVDGGMIPNRFPDFGDAPGYNTADATLWYIHAVDRYLQYTGDWEFVAERMFTVIAEIIESHIGGTRHGIRLCEDGLLAAGERGLALTWMDAQLPDRSITPRIGKPVEINALWHNALRIAASFAEGVCACEQAARWRRISDRCRDSFNGRFWNGAVGCLYDVVDCDGEDGATDASIRPNQLFAVSLTHPVLGASRWRSVVSVCERDLWTPMGMRTLSPSDPAYRGRYEGDPAARDAAYHQGTAWPWLLGPFVTAYVKAFCAGTTDAATSASGLGRGVTPSAEFSDAGRHETGSTRHAARRFLDGLSAHLSEAGLGGISEVADGDPPHTPGGCPWQAWSVAEPLRALCEDILATHPLASIPSAT